jgi:hypothetical protein
MAIGDDFEIQNDKDIRYIGAAHAASGAGYYTVLELHRWLQDRADDASASGDDYMDITRDTPSDKSFDTIINLINSYNVDDTAAEHLYGGSIIQSSGDVIYDGVQIVANAGAHVEIVQNGAIITNDFWNSIPFGSSDKGLNPDSATGTAARFMVKVRTGGADIDGRRLLFQTREWGYTYSEFKVPGTGRGINVVPLTYASDLNNATASGTVAGWSTIANVTAGYNGIDVNNDATDEYYYSEWDRDTYTINQFYERMKYLTRRGSAETLYGLNGELFRGITHEITVDTPTGTFAAVEAVSWSGGTGQMLAINSTTAPTKMWIQLLTGVAPTDNQTITGASAATCLVNVTVTDRTLSFPFCGVSTGTAIIGSYGFGIEALDLSASDKVFDLTNTQYQAPNYVTFTVGGIVSGEDYVLVGPASGGVLDLDFFTLNGALSGAAVTSVVVNEAIPADTPATGTLRIARANGAYTRHPYSAYNSGTKTFTITSHDFSTNNAANGANCYPSYIDKLAGATSETFTAVYAGSDRSLFVRVRDGGGTPIKTFESTGSLGSAGGSATAVRTSDA